jgi:hypothetical protein
VQRGDVREADERLRVCGDQVEVEEGDQLRGAVPAAIDLDDVDLGIREQRLEVAGALLRRAGRPVVVGEDSLRELDAVSVRLPPLDAALDVGAPEDARRRGGDADRPAIGQRLREERRPGQRPTTTAWQSCRIR